MEVFWACILFLLAIVVGWYVLKRMLYSLTYTIKKAIEDAKKD